MQWYQIAFVPEATSQVVLGININPTDSFLFVLILLLLKNAPEPGNLFPEPNARSPLPLLFSLRNEGQWLIGNKQRRNFPGERSRAPMFFQLPAVYSAQDKRGRDCNMSPRHADRVLWSANRFR